MELNPDRIVILIPGRNLRQLRSDSKFWRKSHPEPSLSRAHPAVGPSGHLHAGEGPSPHRGVQSRARRTRFGLHVAIPQLVGQTGDKDAALYVAGKALGHLGHRSLAKNYHRSCIAVDACGVLPRGSSRKDKNGGSTFGCPVAIEAFGCPLHGNFNGMDSLAPIAIRVWATG